MRDAGECPPVRRGHSAECPAHGASGIPESGEWRVEKPDMKHKITVAHAGRGNRTVIKVSLDDDCRNGIEHWSVTADIYENNKDVGGGCCHERILSLRPELAPFVALHLSDVHGAPMHSGANAWYWYAGWKGGLGEQYHGGSGRDGKTPEDCRRILQEHIRATDADMDRLDKAGLMDALEMSVELEDMDFPVRWKAESLAAIAKLEEMTGEKFKSTATKPGGWQKLTEEQREIVTRRRASGWFTPEQIAAREAAKRQAIMEEELADVEKEHAAKIAGLNRDLEVDRWLIRTLGTRHGDNLIYYRHTDTLACNWLSHEKLWTREAFEELQGKNPPEGLKFKFNAKPKY